MLGAAFLLIAALFSGNVRAAVITQPDEGNTLAIGFGTCTTGSALRDEARPGQTYTSDVRGVLAKSIITNCSSEIGGSNIFGTTGFLALGSVATLEQDTDGFTSFDM